MNTRLTKTLSLFLLGLATTVAFLPDRVHSFAPPNPETLHATSLQTPTAVQAVDAVGITVSNMDRAVEFYSRALTFEKISDVEVYGTEYEQLLGMFGVRLRIVRMRLGSEEIELIQHVTPQGRPVPYDMRSNDLWFQHIAIVVRDMDLAYQALREFDITHVSTAPQRLPEYIEAAAGIEAFYFRDPDGNTLELIYFPPDKGDPRWQVPTDRLFLGIDHTAIAVSDTATSLRFYQDILGFKVAGESRNYGTEQEHLNNVEGAELRITGLRSPAGMGVEFLEYLRPGDGRPLPPGTQPNDLIHWETTLVVADAEAVAARLQAAGYEFISDGVVALPDDTLGFRKGFLVRDPDGHPMRIVER